MMNRNEFIKAAAAAATATLVGGQAEGQVKDHRHKTQTPGADPLPPHDNPKKYPESSRVLAELQAREFSNNRNVTINNEGQIEIFYKITRDEVKSKLENFSNHPSPDPYTELVDKNGFPCCHGEDCRPAIIKEIDVPGDEHDGKLAVGMMFAGEVHFYIADPTNPSYSENPPGKLLDNNRPFTEASPDHACIVGGEVRCTVRQAKG